MNGRQPLLFAPVPVAPSRPGRYKDPVTEPSSPPPDERLKRYLVGGAVRDMLLGVPVEERDWLVTGVSQELLLQNGFQQVGQHFPVFLHPETHEEHALPRHTTGSLDDSLAAVEEDLRRRDLTINAIALASDGHLIDPLGGAMDLDNRILRHTPHFREDPIRVLRLARFYARFKALGFHVAPETMTLVRQMVDQGELDQLVPERVFNEFKKALSEQAPAAFFELLRQTGALGIVLPELDRLFGIPQPARYHPEIDTGLHSLMVLQQACTLSPLPEVRFAALVHDVGKGTTPATEWPRHIGHEGCGAPIIQALAKRLRLPAQWRDLAMAASRYHLHAHRALELRPATLLKMLEALDAFRRVERFQQFLIVCEADMRGRKGFESEPHPQRAFLSGARETAANVDPARVMADQPPPRQIATRIRKARVQALAAYRSAFRSETE